MYYRRGQQHPTPVLLPGKSHGWRSLGGCSPWGRTESDMTELLHFHFSLSCIGKGNGNPLQCSCLENPRDRGAWWAAIYGVAQSRTRLKRQQQQQQYVLRLWHHSFKGCALPPSLLFQHLILNKNAYLNFFKLINNMKTSPFHKSLGLLL